MTESSETSSVLLSASEFSQEAQGTSIQQSPPSHQGKGAIMTPVQCVDLKDEPFEVDDEPSKVDDKPPKADDEPSKVDDKPPKADDEPSKAPNVDDLDKDYRGECYLNGSIALCPLCDKDLIADILSRLGQAVPQPTIPSPADDHKLFPEPHFKRCSKCPHAAICGKFTWQFYMPNCEVAPEEQNPIDSTLLGLPNYGQSCFFNSVMNCLFFLPRFREWFAQMQPPIRGEVTRNMHEFMTQYGQNKVRRELLNALRGHSPQFPYGQQSSADNFLQSLLETIDQESKREQLSSPPTASDQKQEPTPVRKMFSIAIEETLECTTCHTSRSAVFSSLSLALNLVPEPKTFANPTLRYSIRASLATELAPVEDAPDAMHSCAKCEKDQIHITKKSVKQIGPALVIYLNRYHVRNSHAEVEVPRRIDMSQFATEAGIYVLSSAIRHMGEMTGGHYVCCAKTPKGWMSFNDRSVNAGEVSDAYLRESIMFIYAKEADSPIA